MTEKRFYYAHGLIFDTHKDNHINKIGTIKDLDIGLRIVNWLNELNDENVKLQARNKYLATKIQRERNSYQKQHEKWEEEIQKENEKLKQQIQQLQHWNKCLAEKRHQELSYKPYTASKSEKELKELLEPKLFNCSDR